MTTTLTTENENSFPPLILWTMTIATGLTVGNLYYCQPLLEQIQHDLPGTDQVLGLVPTMTQVGYALGMLFLVPLGDRAERRRLIVIFTLLSAVSLLVMSFATTLPMAVFFSLMIGLTTMTPQLIIPFAAHLSPDHKRGQVVGTVVSGLLLGILLARTIAGFVGAAFGWRALFVAASVIVFIVAFILQLVLPKSEPTFQGSYSSLIKSVFKLVADLPVLRESMLFGFMLFASFSAFWATLIHLMETPAFALGPRAVGLYGLLGAAGALSAPLIGKMADRRSPRSTVGIGFLMTAAAFVIYWIWGGSSLLALGVGVLVMDIGIQAAHVSNQSRVFALIPAARSRLNTAYMFAYFVGGALGSWFASIAWGLYGWPGVCGTALGFLAVGMLVFALNAHRMNKVIRHSARSNPL